MLKEIFDYGHMETAIEMSMLIGKYLNEGEIEVWQEDTFQMYRDIADWVKEFEEMYDNIDCDTFGFYELVADYVENKFDIKKNDNLKRPDLYKAKQLKDILKNIGYFVQHAALEKNPNELTDKEYQARKGIEQNLMKAIKDIKDLSVN
ncbi:MAG: hypothetical protein ACOCRO_02350 [Halanaerobiales bacterium]